jgi:hypothetical protein
MHPTAERPLAHPASPVPRWWHLAALIGLGFLLMLILLLAVGFVLAGPEQNLALVGLILAGVLALPFVAAVVLWAVGYTLSRRGQPSARILVALSAAISLLTLLGLGGLLLAGR